ncbi:MULTISPECIES: helix-turn-helix domain-containing protein [unclassified Streptomyces]|uniref:helix-turn-helix domain-containing protein n=1 Tax=unclassified Streptomyces TaxID=2593676 RepID=UPI00224F1181|nr:helix-turn-helix domain-containing protein [Streptomyces sp. NBC_00320]MCX5147924.1 helix-turn-helix domain-containing protein [Streptomyces sp. NBC_00320]
MSSTLPTTHQALTVPEVMEALRLSRFTVYNLIRSRALPSFTEGRARRIPADSVRAYLETKLEEAA